MLALSLDTLGLYARSADDLALLADVFALVDRAPPPPFSLKSAYIAACRSPAWDKTEPATRAAFERAIMLLREAGAEVELLDLPPAFDAMPEHQAVVMAGEAESTFLGEVRAQGDVLHDDLRALATTRAESRERRCWPRWTPRRRAGSSSTRSPPVSTRC
jgi:Asp-tRNA(Asn)/Glu-tRNA(Gln) amidotransferase A subunit family amidase